MAGELYADALTELSKWIDDMPVERRLGVEARARIDKVAEEYGEVIEAVIGYEGANSRKGTTHTYDDITDELLDVALAALGAVEHLHGNDGLSLRRLEAHIVAVSARAGVLRTAVDGQLAREI